MSSAAVFNGGVDCERNSSFTSVCSGEAGGSTGRLLFDAAVGETTFGGLAELKYRPPGGLEEKKEYARRPATNDGSSRAMRDIDKTSVVRLRQREERLIVTSALDQSNTGVSDVIRPNLACSQ